MASLGGTSKQGIERKLKSLVFLKGLFRLVGSIMKHLDFDKLRGFMARKSAMLSPSWELFPVNTSQSSGTSLSASEST